MNITLEQVEKIREKTGLSYEEAKAALERNSGDLLDTLIALERDGKSATSGQGGFYSTKPGDDIPDPCALVLSPKGKGKKDHWGKVWDFADFGEIWAAFKDLLHRSVTNQFEVWRADRLITSMPVIVLLLLAVFFFWCTLPLLLVGLFFGFRYRFHGPDLGREAVNKVMDGVSATVADLTENLKHEFEMHKEKKREQ